MRTWLKGPAVYGQQCEPGRYEPLYSQREYVYAQDPNKYVHKTVSGNLHVQIHISSYTQSND